jgi:hypothetical protein
MYSWFSSLRIRRMESELYGGPETVEHVWERDDDFQSFHVRRRDGTDSVPEDPSSSSHKAPGWYKMAFDESSGEMTFQDVSAEK